MVVILQRFTPHNWGLSQRDKSRVTVEGREFLLEENNQTLYQLHGRRTYVAFANDAPVTPVTEDTRPSQRNPTDRALRHRYSTRNKATGSAVDGDAEGTVLAQNTERQDPLVAEPAVTNDTGEEAVANVDGQPTSEITAGYCFKQNDMEVTRDPEYETVKVAIVQTDRLPEKYRNMVKQHLPDIVAGEQCHALTTADIRLQTKLAGGLPDLSEEEIMKKARVRIRMLSRTLKGVTKLSPSEFWKVFWEIMRCTYT